MNIQLILKFQQKSFIKEYKHPREESKRFNIFAQHYKQIQFHNYLFRQNKTTYELEINQFSDKTHYEFVNLLTGFETIDDDDDYENIYQTFNETDLAYYIVLPDRVNWTELGAVSPVKNQHHCGACWAFSTTGSIETQYYFKHGKMVQFSEQNLIDCSSPYNNHGCHGGLMQKAFRYIRHFGIETEEQYPYEHRQGRCRYMSSESKTKIKKYYRIRRGSEFALQYAVAHFGTVSVGVEVSFHYRHYKRGIYHEERCRPHLNHAVSRYLS